MEKFPDFSTLPSHIWADHIIPQIQLPDLYNLATISPLFHEYFIRSTKLSRKSFKSWLQPVLTKQTRISYIYLPVYGILLLDRRNKPLPRDVLKHMMLKLTAEQIKILHNLAVTKLRQEAEQIDEYRVRILQIFHPKLRSVAGSEGFEYIKCDSAVFGMFGLENGCDIHRVVILGMDSYCFDNTDKRMETVYKKYIDYSKVGRKRALFGSELEIKYNSIGVDTRWAHDKVMKWMKESDSGRKTRKIRKIIMSNVDFDGTFRDKSLNKEVNRFRIKNFSVQNMSRMNCVEAIGSCDSSQYLFQEGSEGIGYMMKRMFPNAKVVGLIKLKITDLYGRYLKKEVDEIDEVDESE